MNRNKKALASLLTIGAFALATSSSSYAYGPPNHSDTNFFDPWKPGVDNFIPALAGAVWAVEVAAAGVMLALAANELRKAGEPPKGGPEEKPKDEPEEEAILN